MSSKRIAGFGAVVTSAALVGSAVFAPAALAQSEPTPSAYAVGAAGSLLRIAKTPHQIGNVGEKTVAEVPGHPLIEVEALKANSVTGEASSKILGVKAIGPEGGIPGTEASHLIEADVIKADCTQGDVDSKIVDLKIAGQDVPIDTSGNTAVIPQQLQDVVKVNLDEHIDNPDGSTTVNAVSIQLLRGANDLLEGVLGDRDVAGQQITLASATCAPQEGGDTTPPETGDDNGGNGGSGGADDAGENGLAPQPEPQPGHISVTG